MVDIPGDTTTNSTITVGGTVSDTLEFAGDHDWFGLELTAGQAIGITLQGISISDPYVRIRDSNGAVIYENDDWGPGLDSFVAFAAPVSGPYFIDVGSAPNNQTGTYQLSVSPYAPPPLATNDDIAFQLTNGYWNGDAHHFNASPGGAITVNLTGLTSAGQAVARAALAVWTDIIGVSFPEVGSGGQIVFDDLALGTGAFSESDWTNGIISGSTVNVSLERLGTGTGIVRIGLQTYIHEIAHAIGLGHAGDYNGGTAFSRYPYEAMFLNDGAAVSVMSYFDNLENSYYAGQGFTNNLVATPQAADILAAAALYGLSTTTRPATPPMALTTRAAAKSSARPCILPLATHCSTPAATTLSIIPDSPPISGST
jgi:serralysin